jgi:type III pantothenate kinase
LLLAVDVGNSHTKIGFFDGTDPVPNARIPPDALRGEADLVSLVNEALLGYGTNPSAIKYVAICSVIPAITTGLTAASRTLFGFAPYVINSKSDFGMAVRYDPPSSLGVDRLVNAAAAKALFGSPAIIISMGTATTFDVLDHDGDFAGGAIAPGLGTAADALFARAPRLKRIDYKTPERAIGTTSQECLQSGIMLGYAAMVDGMVFRIRREMFGEPKIIGTGGWAMAVAQSSETIEVIDTDLTLMGIQLIWQRNG